MGTDGSLLRVAASGATRNMSRAVEGGVEAKPVHEFSASACCNQLISGSIAEMSDAAVINGLMIRPLAGADAPGEVVGVFSKDRTAERDYRPFSYPGFRDLRDAGGAFAH